jgi:gluconokinase
MPTSPLPSQYAILEPLRPDERGITIDVSRPVEEIVKIALSVLSWPPAPAAEERR